MNFITQEISTEIIHDDTHLRIRRSICDPRTDFWCRTDSYSIDTGDRSALGGLYKKYTSINATKKSAVLLLFKIFFFDFCLNNFFPFFAFLQ